MPDLYDAPAARLGLLLKNRGLSCATAESCTGGLIGATLTDIPGSSEWYRGGVISYANEAKTRLLGVSGAMLATRGAVSEEVALAMAQGACGVLCADVALASTALPGLAAAVPPSLWARYGWAGHGTAALGPEFSIFPEIAPPSARRPWSGHSGAACLARRPGLDFVRSETPFRRSRHVRSPPLCVRRAAHSRQPRRCRAGSRPTGSDSGSFRPSASGGRSGRGLLPLRGRDLPPHRQSCRHGHGQERTCGQKNRGDAQLHRNPGLLHPPC